MAELFRVQLRKKLNRLSPILMDDMDSSIDTSQNGVADLDRFCQPFHQALSSLGYQQLSSIACTAEDDMIVLTGKLDSFYLKQVAQSVAIKIPGVRSVKNEIEVR